MMKEIMIVLKMLGGALTIAGNVLMAMIAILAVSVIMVIMMGAIGIAIPIGLMTGNAKAIRKLMGRSRSTDRVCRQGDPRPPQIDGAPDDKGFEEYISSNDFVRRRDIVKRDNPPCRRTGSCDRHGESEARRLSVLI